MKAHLFLASLMLTGVAAQAGAGTQIYRCTGTAEQCKHMPPPPAPPAPPVPPAPPAPPAPPPVPELPAEAHAACTGKSPGTRITFTPNKNEVITGTCRQTASGMRLELRQWTIED